jgi:hypothetical protein
MKRRNRFVAALVAIMALLFAQFAVAAYVCAKLSQPPAVEAPAQGEPVCDHSSAENPNNGYRASFDRANSDFYFGDVGEAGPEEIDSIKAGSNAAGPPVDLGWPQLEGTGDSPILGAPHTSTNPFTGVTSLPPIQQYPRTEGRAAIGGYVYRGPIAELQGKYFFTDFVSSKLWSLAFDRNETPDGDNGLRTEITSLWQSLVYDPTDPSYGPSTGEFDMAGLDHLVSFGEDNLGNLYVVDFGNRSPTQSSFNGQYPNAGLGEIFKLVPSLLVTLTVDRETGALTLSNPTGDSIGIRGYTISSPAGAIQPISISTPVAGHYDAPPTGDGSIDPNDNWQITSPPGSFAQFAEATLGDAGALAANQSVTLSPTGGWLGSPYEELQLTLALADGSTAPGAVLYTGNGGLPFARSDLDADGVIDADDWPALRDNHLTDLSSLSLAQAYVRGDLDGDGDNDVHDFRTFKADYEQANGLGSFALLSSHVPEPAAAFNVGVIFSTLCMVRRCATGTFARSSLVRLF